MYILFCVYFIIAVRKNNPEGDSSFPILERIPCGEITNLFFAKSGNWCEEATSIWSYYREKMSLEEWWYLGKGKQQERIEEVLRQGNVTSFWGTCSSLSDTLAGSFHLCKVLNSSIPLTNQRSHLVIFSFLGCCSY